MVASSKLEWALTLCYTLYAIVMYEWMKKYERTQEMYHIYSGIYNIHVLLLSFLKWIDTTMALPAFRINLSTTFFTINIICKYRVNFQWTCVHAVQLFIVKITSTVRRYRVIYVLENVREWTSKNETNKSIKRAP